MIPMTELKWIWNSILLGAGLAMDAVSVSAANALSEPRMTRARAAAIACTFAAFQCAMPLLGWAGVHTLFERSAAFRRVTPWMSLMLLLFIGISMLREGVRGEAGQTGGVGPGALLAQGAATSVDALSAGFTFAAYGWRRALGSALLIAAATWALCMLAMRLARRAGKRLGGRASVLGGVILIAIALELFFRGR